MMTHSPFAGSWFWSPILASIPTRPVCFSPLVTLFFFRLPFNQLNACPRELPGFFCPRWALASRAKISVMSLGTRSPVDLLRDILEVLGAKPPPWSVCLLSETNHRIWNLLALLGLMNPSVPSWPRSVSLFFLSVTTWDNNEISRRSEAAGQKERQKNKCKNESQREDTSTWKENKSKTEKEQIL